MDKVIELYYLNEKIGTVGEKVVSDQKINYDGQLYVGDLIYFEYCKQVYVRHLLKNDEYENIFGFMGFGIDNLEFNNMQKLNSYHNFDKDLFLKINDNNKLEAREFELKEFKLSEIEDILGFKIKLID